MKQLWFLAVLLTLSLTACSTYNVPDSPTLERSASWVIMPMENNSNTPLAAEKVEQILRAQLYAQGINAVLYPKADLNKLTDILARSAKDKHARNWLKTYPADYIISGSVSEWQYKSGLDGEPVVGLTIEVQRASTGVTLWQATGSRGGWGRESLSGTGSLVVNELLAGLQLK